MEFNNVIYMSDKFNCCESLASDFSKWNTNNVTNMSDIFYNCNSFPLKYKIKIN